MRRKQDVFLKKQIKKQKKSLLKPQEKVSLVGALLQDF